MCVFFSFDQMPLSNDWTGDPRAMWVEISSGLAWFYLARCCLSPSAVQPITSNLNVLLWGLRIFSPESFFFLSELLLRKKTCFLFLGLNRLSSNKNNVYPLKILRMIRIERAHNVWVVGQKEGWLTGLKTCKATLYYPQNIKTARFWSLNADLLDWSHQSQPLSLLELEKCF